MQYLRIALTIIAKERKPLHSSASTIFIIMIMITTDSPSTPVSTAIPSVGINPELAQSTKLKWIRASARVFAYHAEVYLKIGLCFAVTCSLAGDVLLAKWIGIVTAVTYGVAAIGKSFLPSDYRPTNRQGVSTEQHLVEDGDVSDDVPLLVDFHDHKDASTLGGIPR